MVTLRRLLDIAGKFSFLSALALFFLLLLKTTISYSSPELDEGGVNVEIVNYKQSVEYKIALPHGSPRLVASRRYDDPKDNDQLGIVVKNLDAKANALKQAAASIHGYAETPINWADFSPDKKMLLAGSEDPEFGAITAVTVFRTPDLKAILHVHSKGRISDLLWTRDSQSLVILEVTSRMEKTPWGLLSALSGHPIYFDTFSLRLLNVNSKRDVRILIPGEFENASAVFRSQLLSFEYGK